VDYGLRLYFIEKILAALAEPVLRRSSSERAAGMKKRRFEELKAPFSVSR